MKRFEVTRAHWSDVFLTAFAIVILAGFALGQAQTYGQWSTMSYTMLINPVHAALMSNGKVLIVSGSGNVPGNTNYQAAVWDPQAGTISTQPVSWDMFCNGMVVLPDGRPFVAGGTLQYDPFYGEVKTSFFDPATDLFTDGPNMAHGRWYPTVTLLGDGRVMVFSGLNEVGNTNTSVEFFSPGPGWSQAYSASWTPPLYPRMHLLPNGKVFYSGSTTTSRLFTPSNQTWTTVATTNYSGTRTYGTSVLLPLTPANNYDPKVMIMGGGNPSTATTEIIDLGATSPAWQWGPNMSQPRIEMNAVILPSGKVLALGGSYNDEDTTTASLKADLYDPATNTFSPAGSNVYPRLYHSVALLLPDATVWIAGSNPQRGTYEPHMEIYKPAYLFTTDSSGNTISATRPSITTAPTNISYKNSFTIQTPDAASISSVVLVRNGAVTHAFDMDQRLVGLSFTAGSGVLTVTAPSNANLDPPGYHMLFLVNTSGVPSTASMVQLGDFALSAGPASQTVPAGGNTSYNVTATSVGGFNDVVSFSVSGLPPGASASFNPASVTGSGSSTLSVSTSSTTPAGTYPLTITGTDGSLTHTASVTLVVTAVGNFSIAATPSSQTVSRGSSTSYAVTITPSGGFTGTVTLSASVPPRVSASFSPSSVTGSGTSILTVKVNRRAQVGTYSVTITGTSGGLVHSNTVGLVIQ